MCGIAGRLNFRSGASVDPAVLGGMGDLLAHRGPDGGGLWHAGAVGLVGPVAVYGAAPATP